MTTAVATPGADSAALRRILTAAWMAIVAGFLLQTAVLAAKMMAGGPFPGVKLIVDVAGGVTWSALVCAGVALGTAAAKARSAVFGLLGVISAPIAFAGAKGVQRGVQAVLELPPDQITPLVYMIGATKAIEYAVFGAALGWLLLRRNVGLGAFIGAGLGMGVLFGGIILALTVARTSPPTPAIVGLAVNEMIFPALCATVIYIVGQAGKHAAALKGGAAAVALVALSSPFMASQTVRAASLQELQPSIRMYATHGGTELKAHVFTPAGTAPERPRAAIVIFHGGGWAEGDAEWAYPRAQHFASRGMVAIAAQYRLSNGKDITPIDSMADARAIIRWARAEATSLGIDPRRIAAYGWSAGGHLAASAAVFDDTDATGVSSRPDALVLASPAVALDEDSWFKELLGGRGQVEDLSPDEHVRAGMPPTVIVQGDVDTVTPLDGVRRFCDRMNAAGNTCELHVFKGFGHLFTPAGMRDDRQPAPDRATAAEAMARADAFLKAHGFQR